MSLALASQVSAHATQPLLWPMHEPGGAGLYNSGRGNLTPDAMLAVSNGIEVSPKHCPRLLGLAGARQGV